MNYNEIEVGMVKELTHKLTQDDIKKFVELTGDDNRLHTDIEYASKTSFKKPKTVKSRTKTNTMKTNISRYHNYKYDSDSGTDSNDDSDSPVKTHVTKKKGNKKKKTKKNKKWFDVF